MLGGFVRLIVGLGLDRLLIVFDEYRLSSHCAPPYLFIFDVRNGGQRRKWPAMPLTIAPLTHRFALAAAEENVTLKMVFPLK
jgi:hypothetical protein